MRTLLIAAVLCSTVHAGDYTASIVAAAQSTRPVPALAKERPQIDWVSEEAAKRSPLPDWYHLDAGPTCSECVRAKRLLENPNLVKWSRQFDSVRVRRWEGIRGAPADIFERQDRSLEYVELGCPKDAAAYSWRFKRAFDELRKKPEAKPKPVKTVAAKRVRYPTRRGGYWTGCSNWRHLTRGPHAGKFDPQWLATLSWNELQSLHSDDHEGRVKWKYVVRPTTRAPVRICPNCPR